MNCGIYYIQNTITGQLYIGQSKNLSKRKSKHFSTLRNGSHFNKYLQRSFNKYGEEAFKFDVIEYCDESSLDDLEIKYINFFNCLKNGFNVCDGGSQFPDNSGSRNGMYGVEPKNKRKDVDENLDIICKEYGTGVPLSILAKKWNVHRKTMRLKLRQRYSKEEMDVINKRNYNSPLITRKSNKGRKHSLESSCNMSKSHNTSGYYRVNISESYTYSKWIDGKKIRLSSVSLDKLKQRVLDSGFDLIENKDNVTGYEYIYYKKRYSYSYYEDGKRKKLSASSLDLLRDRVLDKGLVWLKFDD